MSFWTSPINTLRSMFRSKAPQVKEIRHFYSPTLGREVAIDVYLPPSYRSNGRKSYPLVLFNDGQDLVRAGFADSLEWLWQARKVPYLIAVGVYAGNERIREYGTIRQADYKGRGDKAPIYRDFILNELLPYLNGRYRLTEKPEETFFAGFSLGGLSAFDIAWDNPEVFGGAGVFSGALWWRWADVNPRDPDACRIVHDMVQQWPGPADEQRFWFQTGTNDEQEDRNNNGVIDAIDDTLDLIRDLKNKGYRDEAIRYLEIEGGEHDPQTWGEAMPDFLRWAFASGWWSKD